MSRFRKQSSTVAVIFWLPCNLQHHGLARFSLGSPRVDFANLHGDVPAAPAAYSRSARNGIGSVC